MFNSCVQCAECCEVDDVDSIITSWNLLIMNHETVNREPWSVKRATVSSSLWIVHWIVICELWGCALWIVNFELKIANRQWLVLHWSLLWSPSWTLWQMVLQRFESLFQPFGSLWSRLGRCSGGLGGVLSWDQCFWTLCWVSELKIKWFRVSPQVSESFSASSTNHFQ